MPKAAKIGKNAMELAGYDCAHLAKFFKQGYTGSKHMAPARWN
jgi:hypothetical protein